ncbi:MAG TPA: glutamate-5-semialdehyde dehydrogenase [Chitinophagales bacterium]|jgi:glutamate-5-semialdehyde dehydrogenase|nr:glutamate-5-semialdehyde dehydrogenase [Chitinophagales bacterium]MBP6154502.1 glutamate-5-semialdehyde dehydrogenase [Chitinophagales bacterium]HQV78717.1 glutamate-5-semialdehyde dehydrogenase [Chitinophagales bacterium]HQW79083.1 glutamate-5-semialdehyde dehydrogenase [Chitinophagales bacterium]HRB18694.1 glutamate-5-semialdehyde dehydrogenase [Chitinophagales bacterium]
MDSIIDILKRVSKASVSVKNSTKEIRQKTLLSLAELLRQNTEKIIAANQLDLDKMDDSNPKKDRLLLNESRINDLANSLHDVVKLEIPTGKILSSVTMHNNLNIQKVTVPIGVVGVIYEARPNVTIDVAALCLFAGNAVVLRGGSDAEHTNEILVSIIHEALLKNELDEDVVQLLPVDRKYVKELLEAVKYVDIIIPRGSQQLIDFVREHSKVPTIETGAGVCHTYIEISANLEMAAKIVINAKTQRPSVCNALDTIIVDKKIAATFLPKLIKGFLEFDVEIFADYEAYKILESHQYKNLKRAIDDNFGMEYLSQKCSIKTVENIEEAIEHIQQYSSKHSEAIVTMDASLAEQFLNEIDAAAVYVNASTRFTDGGCFGLGAEIGISTQKLHARGPFALEKLTTEKWLVRGSGQIR